MGYGILENPNGLKNMENNSVKPDFSRNLQKIYEDILAIKISEKDNFKSCMNKFYDVMRKWGIKQGEWTENGSRLINNAEWNMCFQIFKNHKILQFDIWLSLSTPPKDLLAYGNKPKNKK